MNKATLQMRRRALRQLIRKTGSIEQSRKHTSLSCTVQDISANGARLNMENVHQVPDAFQLSVASEGFSAECIVVWRGEKELGVIFESAPLI